MTTYFIDDANDDEPGFIAARPVVINQPTYKIGDGLGGEMIVYGDEMLFAVAEELGDGYCFGCDLQVGDCICDEAPSDFSATFERPRVSGINWAIVVPIGLAAWGLIALSIAALTGWRF